MKKNIVFLSLILLLIMWNTLTFAQYRNPIIYADVPDMSVCRVVIIFI